MRRVAGVALAITILAAAGPAGSAAGLSGAGSTPRRETVTLVAHDSFALSKRVLESFTRRTGITVRVLRAGDAGAALNQVILTKDHPIGDALFGVDTTFLSRALDAGIFSPYRARGLDAVPAALRLDPRHRATPVDYGDVCVNYDRAWFASHHVPVPKTLADLAKPRLRGLLAVENPATSSPGLAFMLATVDRYGEAGWRDYWSRLRDNDVLVTPGWEQAYNGAFTAGGSGGDRPLVVSYASSPPAAVYFADPRPTRSPIGTVLDGCFRQVEHIGVLAGATHERAARRLVDLMLSEPVQADVPLQMFVFPARAGTPLPRLFTRFADVPERPITMAARRIEANRERWIDEWTATVLR